MSVSNSYESLFDKEGYFIDGFDKHNINRYGVDRIKYAIVDNPQVFKNLDFLKDRKTHDAIYSGYYLGYNVYGYDKEGYDRFGYDKEGYDKDGYNKDGYNKKGFNSKGFNKFGFGIDNRNKDGYNKLGYNLKGFAKNGCCIHN